MCRGHLVLAVLQFAFPLLNSGSVGASRRLLIGKHSQDVDILLFPSAKRVVGLVEFFGGVVCFVVGKGGIVDIVGVVVAFQKGIAGKVG